MDLREPTPSELKKLQFTRLNVFWVCLIGYIGYYLCRKNIAAAFPLMSEEFGYTNSQLGLIALYSEIAYATGKFINGPLADKIGGRKIFLIGMVGAIVSNFIFSLGSNLTYFIAVWCICRYFLSMGWGGLIKMIGHWYEPERNGTIMGLISLNFQFGGVLATLFAGFLIAMGTGWKGVFIYPPIVLSIIFIWSIFATKDTPDDVVPGTNFGHGKQKVESKFEANAPEEIQEKPIEIIAKLIKLKSYQLLLLFSFLTTFLRSIFFFWTPKFLVDIGMGTSNAILKSAVFPFLGCIGTIFLGWYTDKYAKDGNRATMMWIMLLGLTISLLLIGLNTSSNISNNLIIILLGLSGFFLLGPYSMSSGCLTLDIAGAKAAGSATGLIDGLGYLGGALAVWSAGYLSDNLGWSQVFFLLTACAFLSALAAFFMGQKLKKGTNS